MPEWFWPQAKAPNTALIRFARVVHWLGYGAAGIIGLIFVAAIIFGVPVGNEIFEAILWILGLSLGGRVIRYVIANE